MFFSSFSYYNVNFCIAIRPRGQGLRVHITVQNQSQGKKLPILSDLQYEENRWVWQAIVWAQQLWKSFRGYVSFTEKGRKKKYTEKK